MLVKFKKAIDKVGIFADDRMYNVSTCNLILDKILMTSSGSSFINEAVNKAKFEATQILRCT